MLLITIMALTAATWYADRVFNAFHQEVTESHLRALATGVAAEIQAGTYPFAAGRLQELTSRKAAGGNIRYTIVDTEGRVLADSAEDPARMRNHRDRPEIAQALAGGAGSAIRYSSTVRRNLVYVAEPVQLDGQLAGVVRTSRPLGLVEDQIDAVFRRMVPGIVGAGLAALVLSAWLAGSITRPLLALEKGAARLAQGDLTHHLPAYSIAELDNLACGINSMAVQLEKRIAAVRSEHNELAAMVSSMIEGVLAIDDERRIFKANGAAAKIFGVVESGLVGKTIDSIIRNATLEDLVDRVFESETPVAGEATFYGDEDRIVKIQGTRLVFGETPRAGVLLVLNDVTRLRRLENMRRQFASDVSHELKTPITSIQGFVETLLDGTLEESPEDARHFLEIIFKQTKRLNSIMEDILLLSRVEQSNGELRGKMELLEVRNVLNNVVEHFRGRAAEKSIAVQVDCAAGLKVRAHPRLIEQAVGNLLDNAINYSGEKQKVIVRAAQEKGNGIAIQVVDHGIGISHEHLSRLFERFYRVDKGRSRQLGGTGLGLAIVKHIVQVHGGVVDAQSIPGRGSTFSIHLPADSAA